MLATDVPSTLECGIVLDAPQVGHLLGRWPPYPFLDVALCIFI